VFNAALLGLILGMMCVKSRSLIPGIAFHFVYNSLGLLHGKFGSSVQSDGVWAWLFRHDNGLLRYQPALLCLMALAAIALLHRLTMGQSDAAEGLSQQEPTRPAGLSAAVAIGCQTTARI
jgi:sodium transport system permease protein